MLTPQTKNAIAEQFVNSGWDAVSPVDMQCTTVVARKNYNTAVGVKSASVHVAQNGGGYILTADYMSEGRNILSGTYGHIPSDEDIQFAVYAFTQSVDTMVSQSYAARLV